MIIIVLDEQGSNPCCYRSVGHFDYSGDLDTCIAIRTMLFKDGVAYLQGECFMANGMFTCA